MKWIIRRPVTAGILVLLMTGASVSQTQANTGDWQPLSSERLIKLPTNVMEKALEHDFQKSPLAVKIKEVDQRLGSTQTDLSSLQKAIKQTEGDEKVELRHQFLEQKSAYIDQMEVKQTLRRSELKTRLGIYQGLLDDMRTDKRRAKDPVSNALRDKQRKARARMENGMAGVDESLFEMTSGNPSRYAQEYDNNWQKMKQLQQAIRDHSLNASEQDGDQLLTREAYVRQLLIDAEADLALLDQEDEMLGYMARLVAMDAQALQIELTYGNLDLDAIAREVSAIKPANMVDFYTN